uniref:PQQ-dependent sugar dehydrogenase n=1 Tax=Thaumasiovibrio occultus TaxID=1891184 RepID=UPI00192D1313|nr:PQQ-dependent sugar dehydrogenase [Thaumasiovibrio occultus]
MAGLVSLSAIPTSWAYLDESSDYQLQATRLAQLDGIPWGMAWFDDKTLLITLREGKLLRVDISNGRISELSGLPAISAKGQGGLLDIYALKVSDETASTRPFLFTYTKAVTGGDTTVLALALVGESGISRWQDLVVTDAVSDTDRHFGSRISQDSEGNIYFSIGDRGVRENGQRLDTMAAKILRVTSLNPLNVETWSYGHRNPQGLAFDSENQRLWAIEHGPRGGDELNHIEVGNNYGWPLASHGKEYWGPLSVGEEHVPGTVAPLKVYTPSIAPSSLLYYQGDEFPAWQGDLLAGSLKLTHLNRIIMDENGMPTDQEERLLSEMKERIRSLLIDDAGRLYFTTDNGNLYRLTRQEWGDIQQP